MVFRLDEIHGSCRYASVNRSESIVPEKKEEVAEKIGHNECDNARLELVYHIDCATDLYPIKIKK